MMLSRLVFVLVLALAWPPGRAAAVEPGIGGRVIEGFVAPTLAAFAASAESLEARLATLCAAPDPAALDAARNAYRATVVAFGRASTLRFGPLAADGRVERLFFWPDARGVTLRQVEALIAAAEPSAATPAGLAAKSVAVQGLPALDYVLAGSGSETLLEGADGYRCRYGLAITGQIAALAAGLGEAWAPSTDFARSFAEPGPDRDPYRSKEEVAGEIIKALGTALQFTRDAELLAALGDSLETARGRRAPLWRSDTTFALVGAQIEGIDALLAAAGFEASLTGEARSNLAAIRFDLDHAAEALETVSHPAEDAFSDPQDRETIRYVTVALKSALQGVNEKLAADLQLTMGFNALDGD